MRELKYSTRSGIAVTRVASKLPFKKSLTRLLKDLDSHRGVYLSSGYEFPGRYSRWDFASTRPPQHLPETITGSGHAPVKEEPFSSSELNLARLEKQAILRPCRSPGSIKSERRVCSVSGRPASIAS